jgi:predicted P-loop ATPase
MAVDHFNCDDTPYARQCVRKTMIAAVARARNPGCKFDTILVLESPEGWNKSTAWLLLAGGPDNFSDESILGKASREVQEQLADIWIHENAELAGLRKADIDTVRAYASRTEDRARPAYGHLLVRQRRQSIEVGTTNSFEGYLQAQNGNRRFWPVRLKQRIDLTRLRAERLQLWGEAAHYQSAGESLTLDPELWPFAAAEQEARRVRDPWEPTLENLSPVSVTGPLAGAGYIGNGVVHVAEGEERVATAVIFEHVIRIPSHLLSVTHAKRLADAMRALGWETKLFKLEGKPVRGYARKVR